MTKCNRKKQLLGKSIRNVRMRRNMTQRALAKSTDGVSESPSSAMTNSYTHSSS